MRNNARKKYEGKNNNVKNLAVKPPVRLRWRIIVFVLVFSKQDVFCGFMVTWKETTVAYFFVKGGVGFFFVVVRANGGQGA